MLLAAQKILHSMLSPPFKKFENEVSNHYRKVRNSERRKTIDMKRIIIGSKLELNVFSLTSLTKNSFDVFYALEDLTRQALERFVSIYSTDSSLIDVDYILKQVIQNYFKSNTTTPTTPDVIHK